MKKFVLAVLIMLIAPLSIASSERNMPDSSRYEACLIDGKIVMMQPNMCYAMGGRRGG
ncbi:hypothetical protein QTO12_01145 [Vibrio owensii]|uniref:hypothetical protein n=1 Tax=Vibrio owensii TaxID=696485 RepID=UPI002F428C26